MSESSKPTLQVSSSPAQTILGTDDSCRLPCGALFAGAALWLFVSAILGLITSLKLHAPYFFADAAWLTYGRVQPAQMTALVYGFAIPAGLAVTLWIITRLGEVPVKLGAWVISGVVLWNLGLVLGMGTILGGGATGFEGFEIPGQITPLLFIAYALVAVPALITFAHRQRRELYVSQWFVLAALFWFPWIYSTANVLLLYLPVRGVLQTVVGTWYWNNLLVVWFGCVGLAALLYLIPQALRQRLHSSYLAMLTFWMLLICGSWMGIPDSAPLPAWMSGISTVFSVLLIVGLLAMAMNAYATFAGRWGSVWKKRPLLLAMVALFAWFAATSMAIAGALPAVGRVVQFTFFIAAKEYFLVVGFFALAVFAVFYSVAPDWMRGGLPSARLSAFHIWGTLIALLVFGVPMAIGGLVQGTRLNDPSTAFMDAFSPGLMALRIATMGDLVFLVASAALLLNLVWALLRGFLREAAPRLRSAFRTEPEEVTS